MSDKVKFITVDYLKENSTIQDNVDSNILVPFVYKSQDTHLQQALGTTFFDRLKDGVVNSNLNADETSLILDYIQPMVSEWTLYEVMPHINYKLTNKAISKESSEFSSSSELSELKYLRQAVRDMAEFYTKRLITFLCDNYGKFPEYDNPDNDENLRRSNKAYFNGVLIPRSTRVDRYHKN